MAATATGGVIGLATSASAGTPPTGPGNIEVFPSRDMVAIEGYTAQAGQTATLTVTRGGQTVGTATGEVDATGFMEWNHEATPNGDGTFAGCFTDVTPDIQPGDEVSVRFSGSPLVDGMRVSSAEVTEVTASEPAEGNVNTVTIRGTYGSDVDLNRFAVEVVNPEMREAGSAIGERAISWGPNEPPAATQGYTVEGTAANGEFSVTFGGLSPSDQQLVFDGEKVALSWMADATTVEAQLGLTLSEFGLVGGGAPGCAPGPAGAEPPAGEFSVVWANQSEATITWNSAAPVAGGEAVDGYSVEAIDQTADANGAQRTAGYRVGADATQVVLGDLDPGALYDIEVRSIVNGEIGAPFALAGTAEPTPPEGTALQLTSTPAFSGDTAVIAEDRQLTLSANAGTIYYTVDGSAVTTQPNGNVPSATAKIYTAPVPITAENTRVNVAVIDATGAVAHATGVVSPKPAAAAVAPGGLAITSIAGSGPNNDAGRVSLAWNPVPDATEYRVRAFLRTDATNINALQAERDVVVTGTTADVSGLPKSEPGTRWVFRVQSKTAAGAQFSALSNPGVNVVLPGDSIGLTLAQFRTGDEFRISGSGTVPGATVTVHRPNTAGTGPAATPIAGYPSGTVGALEAPENTGPWQIVLDPAPATAPTTIWIKSSLGGVAGPFTVEVR
ncbi:fibronectin type III domain-containing protein [Geodermatophilus sp. SYSU D00708]